MTMSSLTAHTRLYLLRMSFLFLTFQDRISKGLTGVTFYQQKSLHFQESTTMSQVMSGPDILVHPPGITLWIIKGKWSYRHELALTNALATVLCTHPPASLSSFQGSGGLVPPGCFPGDDMQ